MSAYRPYPKYKPSGVEWLGDVPEEWEVIKMRYLCFITTGSRDTENAIEDGKFPFSVRSQTIERINEFTHNCEAILTAGDGVGVGKVFHYFNGKFTAHQRVYILNHFVKVQGGFLFSYFSGLFHKVALAGDSKSTVDSLRRNNFTDFSVCVPSSSEQIQIAAFLDRECGKLDALQAKQERLIELLKEKRQALISHAVTRGLDPAAKLKPSGIEWLGDVPEHWSVRKLGLISSFKGGAGFPDDHQGQSENEIPFFKVGDIMNSDGMGVMRQANHTITRETAKLLRAFIFPCGTVVFAKVGAALLLKRFRTLGQPSCIDNNMMGMTAGKDTLAGFLIYVLPLLDFELIVNPGAVPSINEGQISSQRIALPPLAEQRAIVAHLDEKCGKIDQLKAKAERAIELLKERRSALISAAVTGKIDVRESAN